MLQKSRTCVGVGWEDEGKVIISMMEEKKIRAF